MRLFTLSACLLIAFATFSQNPLWMRYPSISPDGSQIAFNYKGDIYLVSSKGGEARAITTHEDHDFLLDKHGFYFESSTSQLQIRETMMQLILLCRGGRYVITEKEGESL